MKQLRETLKTLKATKEFVTVAFKISNGAIQTYSGSIAAYDKDRDQFTFHYDDKMDDVHFTPSMVETVRVVQNIYTKQTGDKNE